MQVRGVEFKVSGFEGSSLKTFNWYVGGNILDITVADDISSKYITNAAGLNFSAGLFFIMTDYLKLSTDVIYRKRDVTEDQSIEFGLTSEYFVMDAKLTYRLSIFDIDLTVKNLFDREYSDILGVQLPGRWFMLGVSISDDMFISE